MTIIRTTRFDSTRELRAKNVREYDDGLRELNAPPPDMAQMRQTRGPDCIDEDVRFIMRGLAAGLIVCLIALIIKKGPVIAQAWAAWGATW